MKKTRYLIVLLIIIFSVLLIPNMVNAAEEKFSLEAQSVDIALNGSKFLNCTGGTGDITWKSSDTSVATVEGGSVKALKIGTTTITATRGSETASCTVNVVYSRLLIETLGAHVNLYLNEHNSEKIVAKVYDASYKEVSNATITWKSSDTSIVTVNDGTVTAVKPGTATITASAAGVSNTCEVKVYAAPEFTDFSNAKYEIINDGLNSQDLKITGINLSSKSDKYYYYIITPSNSKPSIEKTKFGTLDTEKMKDSLVLFNVNKDEKYIFNRNFERYTELNQDMYIWILEQIKLEDSYYESKGNAIQASTKFVVEGKKLTRPELPKLNLILKSIDVASSGYNTINFNFPTSTENRKFNIKIGKVTDSSILSKIQKNDYTGIQELLKYAKNNNSIYSENLTTTSTGSFGKDGALFDGRKLLEDKAYYYIYVKFDDENGKYYPIEGVTLGKATIIESNGSWDLFAFTSSDFNWDGLTSTPTGGNKGEDTTTAKGNLPQTGVGIGLTVTIVLVIVGSVFVYNKYRRLKGI